LAALLPRSAAAAEEEEEEEEEEEAPLPSDNEDLAGVGGSTRQESASSCFAHAKNADRRTSLTTPSPPPSLLPAVRRLYNRMYFSSNAFGTIDEMRSDSKNVPTGIPSPA
jgi:hypothetical protein